MKRWHWVYTTTCFRLSQRCLKGRAKNKPRAVITERGYVATRVGVEPLMQQLFHEARARGLCQAQRALVIAVANNWCLIIRYLVFILFDDPHDTVSCAHQSRT